MRFLQPNCPPCAVGKPASFHISAQSSAAGEKLPATHLIHINTHYLLNWIQYSIIILCRVDSHTVQFVFHFKNHSDFSDINGEKGTDRNFHFMPKMENLDNVHDFKALYAI